MFPKDFESRLEILLQSLGYSLKRPKELATAVLKLSDHFIKSDGRHTPWNEAFCRAAYLAYFTPLNVVRLSGVLRELAHLDYFSGIDCVEECGSGAGALALAFAGELSRGTVPQLFCSDGDSWAATAHEELSDVEIGRAHV